MKKSVLVAIIVAIGIASLTSCKKTNSVNDTIRLVGDPQVSFQFAGDQVAPATISFINDSRNANRFSWDFGNGQLSGKQSPSSVTYHQPGNYDILLTATNDEKRGFLKKTIVISADQSPAAHFSYVFKDQRSAAPATIILNNESVNATTYEWDINGRLYNDKIPQNIMFDQPGVYTIKLKAIKNGISSPVFQELITILANPDPVAGFQLAYHPYPYKVGEEIQLVNRSENSDVWNWSFGVNGPAPSTAQHPNIKFSAPGNYTITLIAKKGSRASPAKTVNIKIEL